MRDEMSSSYRQSSHFHHAEERGERGDLVFGHRLGGGGRAVNGEELLNRPPPQSFHAHQTNFGRAYPPQYQGHLRSQQPYNEDMMHHNAGINNHSSSEGVVDRTAAVDRWERAKPAERQPPPSSSSSSSSSHAFPSRLISSPPTTSTVRSLVREDVRFASQPVHTSPMTAIPAGGKEQGMDLSLPSQPLRSFASLLSPASTSENAISEVAPVETDIADSAPPVVSKQQPTEILRNPDVTRSRVLFDPKKNAMVEIQTTPAAPIGKPKTSVPPTKKAEGEAKDNKEPISLNTASTRPRSNFPVNPETERLKAARREEKKSRGARTKGELWEVHEDGGYRQVLSEAERALKLQEETKRKAEAAIVIPPFPKPSAVVNMNIKPKPAWTAPGKTREVLGVSPVETSSSPSVDAPLVGVKDDAKVKKKKAPNAPKKPKGKEKKPSNEIMHEQPVPSSIPLPIGPHSSSSGVGKADDMLNLDIINQIGDNAVTRDPSSYPTFIPGSGLSPASIQKWTPDLFSHTEPSMDLSQNNNW